MTIRIIFRIKDIVIFYFENQKIKEVINERIYFKKSYIPGLIKTKKSISG